MPIEPFTLNSQLQQDCLYIHDLDLCTVLLMNESQFPWVVLVPRCPDITEIYQLNDQQQRQLQTESNMISKVLLTQYPDCKLNIANLGNIVSQLHIHHVARFENDATWPAPVWGNFTASPFSPSEIDEQVAAWRAWLS